MKGKPPTAISAQQVTTLCKALALGHTDTVACRIANVHIGTFRHWCRRGGHNRFTASQDWTPPEQARSVFRRFVVRIERAQAKGEIAAVETIIDAAEHDWHAAAWFLARRWPERWGKNREKLNAQAQHAPGEIFVYRPTERESDGGGPPLTADRVTRNEPEET